MILINCTIIIKNLTKCLIFIEKVTHVLSSKFWLLNNSIFNTKNFIWYSWEQNETLLYKINTYIHTKNVYLKPKIFDLMVSIYYINFIRY